MSDETGKSVLLATFVLAIGLVTWSELKDNHRVPMPSRYVGAGIVWGTLGLVAPFITYPLAGVLGLGMLVALYYQHWKSPASSGGSITGPGGTLVNPPGGGDVAIQPPLTAPLN